MASKRTKEGFGVQFKRKRKNERITSLLAAHRRAPDSRISVSELRSRGVINVIDPNLNANFERVSSDTDIPQMNEYADHYPNQNKSSLVLESLDNTPHPSFARKLASWAVNERVTHNSLQSLLRLLKIEVTTIEDLQNLSGRNTIVIDSDWYEPATYSEADAVAAETKLQFVYGMYANPVVYGNWPQVMIDNVARFSKAQGFNESRLPSFSQEEIELIKGTYDFLAVNHYTTYMVSAISDPNHVGGVSWDEDSGVNSYQKDTWETAAIGWFKVVPWGFGKLLRWMKKSYGDQEIVITENGVSDTTGTLRDQHRIEYLRSYMSHMIDAIYDGVNVTAYTVWSIIDNFEWTQGFNAKLGMYYVNMSDPLKPRIAKDSSKYLANVIKTRCLLDSGCN